MPGKIVNDFAIPTTVRTEVTPSRANCPHSCRGRWARSCNLQECTAREMAWRHRRENAARDWADL